MKLSRRNRFGLRAMYVSDTERWVLSEALSMFMDDTAQWAQLRRHEGSQGAESAADDVAELERQVEVAKHLRGRLTA